MRKIIILITMIILVSGCQNNSNYVEDYNYLEGQYIELNGEVESLRKTINQLEEEIRLKNNYIEDLEDYIYHGEPMGPGIDFTDTE